MKRGMTKAKRATCFPKRLTTIRRVERSSYESGELSGGELVAIETFDRTGPYQDHVLANRYSNKAMRRGSDVVKEVLIRQSGIAEEVQQKTNVVTNRCRRRVT